MSPRKPIKAQAQVVADFFRQTDDDGTVMKYTCEAAGVDRSTCSLWRLGRSSPRVDLFEAVVQAAGYRLIVVKIEKPGK